MEPSVILSSPVIRGVWAGGELGASPYQRIPKWRRPITPCGTPRDWLPFNLVGIELTDKDFRSRDRPEVCR